MKTKENTTSALYESSKRLGRDYYKEILQKRKALGKNNTDKDLIPYIFELLRLRVKYGEIPSKKDIQELFDEILSPLVDLNMMLKHFIRFYLQDCDVMNIYKQNQSISKSMREKYCSLYKNTIEVILEKNRTLFSPININYQFKDNFSITLLHAAVFAKDKSMYDFLVAHGSNEHIPDLADKSPLTYSKQKTRVQQQEHKTDVTTGEKKRKSVYKGKKEIRLPEVTEEEKNAAIQALSFLHKNKEHEEKKRKSLHKHNKLLAVTQEKKDAAIEALSFLHKNKEHVLKSSTVDDEKRKMEGAAMLLALNKEIQKEENKLPVNPRKTKKQIPKSNDDEAANMMLRMSLLSNSDDEEDSETRTSLLQILYPDVLIPKRTNLTALESETLEITKKLHHKLYTMITSKDENLEKFSITMSSDDVNESNVGYVLLWAFTTYQRFLGCVGPYKALHAFRDVSDKKRITISKTMDTIIIPLMKRYPKYLTMKFKRLNDATPLHIGVICGDISLTNFLLHTTPEEHIKSHDAFGMTAKDYATKYAHIEEISDIEILFED